MPEAFFEAVGNTGHTYRIDGTKFAVISNSLNVAEFREKYDRFRAYLHEHFTVDGKSVLLDLHCGALRVEHFDVDSQTVYACLNYADEESKLQQHGNMVEFRDDLNEENHQRLEKIHAIRASIKHGYEGFYLLYQPVVDAQTERLIGAEALLRWKNDRYGMVPPDQFIPILESDPCSRSSENGSSGNPSLLQSRYGNRTPNSSSTSICPIRSLRSRISWIWCSVS